MPELAIELGLAAASRRGERVNGDLAVVEHLSSGAFLAVVDGAGHGPEAHRVASAAMEAIRRSRREQLAVVMGSCHEALRGTRGAAVALALLSTGPRTLTWLGVGTVEGRVLNTRRWPADGRASLRLQSGTLGHELPALVPRSVPLHHGDLVVLSTDGVHPRFDDVLDPRGSSQEVAERILAGHRRDTDDALVAVARFVARESA